MVDSVVFRIHDLQKNEAVVRYLHKNGVTGTSFMTQISEEVNTSGMSLVELEEYRRDRLAQHLKRRDIQGYFVNYDTGERYEGAYRAHLSSSHYDVAYSINFNGDFMEFNFSVPKYLYGTNVLQFVPHHFDRDYLSVYLRSFEEIGRVSYDRFKRFMSWFLSKYLDGQVDLHDVEIRRIDLCYNKIFNSSDAVQYYLNEIQRIRDNHERQDGDSPKYTTGASRNHDDYTFKFYHKGPEFRKNDRKRLKVRGELNDGQLNALQALADRTLRYEVEFKPGLLNRLFKRHVFRRKSKNWKVGLKIWKSLSLRPFVTLNGFKKDYRSLDSGEKLDYKFAKLIMGNRFGFFLDGDMKYREDNGPISLEARKIVRNQKFSRLLFTEMVRFLKKKIDRFTVTYKHDFQNVIHSIEPMFSDNKQRSEELRRRFLFVGGSMALSEIKCISFSACKRIVEELDTKTWDQLKKGNTVSMSHFYRYKKFLSAWGVGEIASTKLFAEGKNDFVEYHCEIDQNYLKYGVNGVLRSVF